jgi:formiminotetrahydrofolate cyclodeaminase
METALKAYQLLAEMAKKGNPASISDVGVGLLALRAGVDGAAMNVRINLVGLKDEQLKSTLQEKMQRVSAESETWFKDIRQTVEGKLG